MAKHDTDINGKSAYQATGDLRSGLLPRRFPASRPDENLEIGGSPASSPGCKPCGAGMPMPTFHCVEMRESRIRVMDPAARKADGID